MLNSTTLEVAIGMALVYLLVSFLCTSINEGIAGALGSRARNLEEGVRSLFSEGRIHLADGSEISLTEAIYNHGLVQGLYPSGKGHGVSGWYGTRGPLRWLRLGRKLPSYIPARTFSAALFEVVFPQLDQDVATSVGSEPKAGQQASASTTADESSPATAPPPPPPKRSDAAKAALAVRALQRAHMLRALDKLPDSAPREALQALVRQADGDLLRTRALFEDWYNDAMDRVSGWYKHRTQIILFALGLSTAMLVNVDSIAVGRALWNTPAVRSYAMAQAEKYAQPNADAGAGKAEERVKELESLTLPVGWDAHWQDTPNWKRGHWMALLGWLMTAFAVTLGSPFWFDVLNRFMVVRSTVKPQEKSAVEAPKDPTVAGGASEG